MCVCVRACVGQVEKGGLELLTPVDDDFAGGEPGAVFPGLAVCV